MHTTSAPRALHPGQGYPSVVGRPDTGSEASPSRATDETSDAIAPMALCQAHAWGPPPRPAWRRAPSALLASAMDEIDFGVAVADHEGGLIEANHAAHVELACGPCLHLVDGRLAARDRTPIQPALGCAVQRGLRQLLELGQGEDRLFVSVSPLPAGEGQSLALLVMGRRTPCSRLGLEMLASRYGLTETERRVLARLVEGENPADLATRHGVAVSTVRTQISSIRAKMGAQNYRSLINMAAAVPNVAGALRMVSPESSAGRLSDSRQGRHIA